MAAAAAKVVVATELPSKGKGILQAALPEKDVWFWPETGGIPREELLARVKGAELLLVSLREKVGCCGVWPACGCPMRTYIGVPAESKSRIMPY